MNEAIPLVPLPIPTWVRRKAPRLIVAGTVIIVVVIVLLEILEDVVVEGTPLTSSETLLWLWNGILLITRNATAAVSSFGYVGVFVLMLLESSSLPIPSEVVLPFAGYLVSLGKLEFWLTLAVATIAAIAGSLVDYYVGFKGWNFLNDRQIFSKILVSKRQIEVATGWFNKHGVIVVLLGRFIPGFRTIVSFPAGMAKMSIAKFITYTTAGCLIWNGLLIYLGYFLGSQWTQVAGYTHYLILLTIVALGAALVSYLVWWRRKAKRNSSRIQKLVWIS